MFEQANHPDNADGPVRQGVFRVNGVEREVKVEPTPWGILEVLWKRGEVKEEELAEIVCGDAATGTAAIKLAVKRANDALRAVKAKAFIERAGGFAPWKRPAKQ